MEKPTIIEVYSDNGALSHFALIESSTGIKLWSENPQECAAMGYPVDGCPSCSGTGYVDGDHIEEKECCITCNGQGMFKNNQTLNKDGLVDFLEWYLKGDSKKHESIEELVIRYIKNQ